MLGDVGRDLGAEAAELCGLVGDDELARLRHRAGDQLGVERGERARIDNLGADALALESACGAQRVRDERAEGDDGDVRSFADDAPDAEFDAVPLARHGRGLGEEELLLLEEDHRVLSPDRRGEEALRVVGARGHHDHEAGKMREERFEALRVLGAEARTPPPETIRMTSGMLTVVLCGLQSCSSAVHDASP